MFDRVLYFEIKRLSGQYPVLALTGPRQSGKTTLLRKMFSDYRYVTLENPDMREYAQKDTKGFLSTYDHQVIFDEAQNVPELFSYLQSIVDDSGQMGQFILSGSQNFHLMERITQSLAGRVAIFHLLPFENQEMKAAGWLHEDVTKAITRGFYPAVHQRGADQDRYYANYLETYVKRDVSQLVNVQDVRGFKAFVKLCAIRAGQVLNLSDLARDAGVSHTTARNWISVLETSFILFLLPPYYDNYGKRLIKSPKLYFYDSGLLSYLLGVRKGNLQPTHPHWGHLFENMVVGELVKQNAHRDAGGDFYYWRDSKGHEVDLLVETEGGLDVYEVKGSATIKSKMFEGLDYFSKITGGKERSRNLVYAGAEAQKRTDYQVMPWNQVLLEGK